MIRELFELVEKYGWVAVFLLVIAIQLAPVIKAQIGKIVDHFLGDRDDKRESRQAVAQTEMDIEKAKVLAELADLSGQSFTREQVTQMTSELQGEASKWNEFYRERLVTILCRKFDEQAKKLDKMIVLLGRIADDLTTSEAG